MKSQEHRAEQRGTVSGEVGRAKPRLRALDPKLIEHEGREFLYLRDPLSLSDDNVLVPSPLVPLLALCDGTRDLAGLRSAFALRTGIEMADGHLVGLIERLDSALLLEGPRFDAAAALAVSEYRSAPSRMPFHAGAVYPEDAADLREMLAGFCEAAPAASVGGAGGRLVGMLSPHIDFARGGRTYAQTWQAAAADLDGIELAIVLGTDHMGRPASLTLTAQGYSTPLGALATDVAVVERLAGTLGAEEAFRSELHHRSEHSIELACVWMHSFLESREPRVVPVLCGSFAGFAKGDGHPRDHAALDRAIDVLASAAAERPTLVIAAADLAHVGPVFGDPAPVRGAARHGLELHDQESLAAVCEGDAGGFLDLSVREGDRRRICGLSPIYLMLEVLRRAHGAPASGLAMGYDQCPADDDGGSLVSIAGALLYS